MSSIFHNAEILAGSWRWGFVCDWGGDNDWLCHSWRGRPFFLAPHADDVLSSLHRLVFAGSLAGIVHTRHHLNPPTNLATCVSHDSRRTTCRAITCRSIEQRRDPCVRAGARRDDYIGDLDLASPIFCLDAENSANLVAAPASWHTGMIKYL